MPPAEQTPVRGAEEAEETEEETEEESLVAPGAQKQEAPAPHDATTGAPAAFGSQEPTRVAADVAYRGRVGEHDYLVRVRHRLLDTSFTVEIDGIVHDPKAEQKARATQSAKTGGPEPDRSEAPAFSNEPPVLPDDGLQFRFEEHFTTLYCTVRRPDEDGDLKDAEVLTVRTAGLGGAGEVDVRLGLTRRPLAPDAGSPSAVRDRKRTAHPTRYALLAAVTKAAAFLIPLLGLGALFSGILQPVREWVAGLVTAIIEAVAGVVSPVLDWIDELLRPIREFIDALTRPIRDVVAALLQPVRDLVDWLRGLLPELSLPFDVPGWVVDLAVPVIIVLVVFALTYRRLRTRRERLEAARASAAEGPPKPDGSEVDAADGGGEDTEFEGEPASESASEGTEFKPETEAEAETEIEDGGGAA